ncbi:hypothetical protein GGD54_002717 [Rhizobium tropici]|uniref:Uncharacterized protein n=1 Tax=Rhizobium tropici TaxID=398 RepID=A0ABR6QZH8_RHITR|nr:hypothetical protein [Rhizobium tropici]MBB5593366.1 hypothetical protein [Rhizobium tropici]MBB6492313.1 hypothetical protein [Rhizobium tropici]
MAGQDYRRADGGCDANGLRRRGDGPVQFSDNTIGNFCKMLGRKAFVNDGEFIAANARHHIGLGDRACEPSACRLEAIIPGLMTESIVYGFEAVEIHQKERSAGSALGCAYFIEKRFESGARRQPGEHVVLGQLTKLLDHRLLGGDILLHPKNSSRNSVREFDAGGYSDPSPIASCGNDLSIQAETLARANCLLAHLIEMLSGLGSIEFKDLIPRQRRLRRKIKEFVDHICPAERLVGKTAFPYPDASGLERSIKQFTQMHELARGDCLRIEYSISIAGHWGPHQLIKRTSPALSPAIFPSGMMTWIVCILVSKCKSAATIIDINNPLLRVASMKQRISGVCENKSQGQEGCLPQT